MKIGTSVEFEAAHRLSFYEGKCNRMHGHNWKVDVEIESSVVEREERNIIMDFTEIKAVINELDHKVVLQDNKDNRKIAKSIPDDWIVWLKREPTAENLSLYFKEQFEKILLEYHNGVFFTVEVTVWESAVAYAKV